MKVARFARGGLVALVYGGSIAGAVLVFVAFSSSASCSAASDFVPYPCDAAVPVDAAGANFVPTLSAARLIYPGVCPTDGAAPPADVVTLVACDDFYDAFFRGTDGGALVVDYYSAPSNSFVARMTYATTSSDGMCVIGPGSFLPPACNGAMSICCGSDAGVDSGLVNDAGCGAF